MKPQKTFFALSIMFVFAVLFVVGCEPAEKPKDITVKKPKEVIVKPQRKEQVTPVEMPAAGMFALKFKPGGSATYKVILEKDKSLEFTGEVSEDQSFKSGHTGSKAEITFARQVQSVDSNGVAVEKVTIKALKYLMNVKNQVIVDFDSSRPQDSPNAFNQLVGKSYEITINPKGEVVKVSGAVEIEASVSGNAPAQRAAAQLVSDEIVKKCHEVPALIDAEGENYKPGDKWKGQKTFSFDLMGSDSYEKIYTLKEIKDENGKRTALVDMIAVPGPEAQSDASLSKMFVQTSDYSGTMKFDLTAGQVERYSEQMKSEWTVIDSESAQQTGKALSTIKMGTTELYSFEKIY